MSQPTAAVPLHRLFHHFSELPSSLRVLFTAALMILGFGYIFGLIYVFHTYSAKDGNPLTLTYEDIVIGYSGSGKHSRLETALRGSMSTMLPPEDISMVVSWVQQGADRTRYEQAVRPALERRCMSCHDGTNPHLPNLSNYESLKKVTERDTGADIFTLVRVSHIHLFGLTFIFFIMGYVFSHAYVRPVWFKSSVIAAPFVAIVVDVSSWYFTKIYHPFAWLVLLSGGVMGLCFSFMWVVSIYQMWFSRTPGVIMDRSGHSVDSV
ncbi:MAG: elongation factor-1 alpha [Betaproteobacteria bacterium]